MGQNESIMPVKDGQVNAKISAMCNLRYSERFIKSDGLNVVNER